MELLDKGPKQGDILIMGVRMWQPHKHVPLHGRPAGGTELEEGETGCVIYEDKFSRTTHRSQQPLFLREPPFYRGEDSYTAHAYNLGGVSYDSNIVFVDNTAVNAPEAETAVDANTPLWYITLSGSVVARGTVGNMPAMPKGVLIVTLRRQGTEGR